MKKIAFIGVSVLVVAMVLAGCAAPAAPTTPTEPTTPTTPTTPTEPTEPTEPEETYTFVYHCPWPPGQILCDIEDLFLDNVEEKSGGRITFDRIYGGTLGDLTVQPEQIQNRVFDIGQVSYVYSPGQYPLGAVTTLPGIEDDTHVWGPACHEASKTDPNLIAEYDALNSVYLFTWGLEPMEIAAHHEIDELEDFCGDRVRTHGGSTLAFDALAEALGCTIAPTTVHWGELPVAGAEHVVDSACFPVPVTGRDAGLHTVFPYYITPFPVYQFHFATAINMDAFNELPPELQDIMLECADEAVEDGLEYLDGKIAGGLQDLEDVGVITIDFPASEMQRFRDLACTPVWADWIADMEAQGLPGQAVFDNFNAILATYR
jgi:TRAP-type C4-dicarboxylate transport system substrate-binding protein